MNRLIFLILISGAVQAADDSASTAKQKSQTCVACHGPDGHSTNPLWPNLAGQKEQYIIKQLKAFRDGTRVDPLMSPVAHMLSDQDIEELARYFAEGK